MGGEMLEKSCDMIDKVICCICKFALKLFLWGIGIAAGVCIVALITTYPLPIIAVAVILIAMK